ncbi:MAG: ribosomal protein [Actinoallomurus sp.]|nr:ribosomal protein [Actinoallomurus sp.]
MSDERHGVTGTNNKTFRGSVTGATPGRRPGLHPGRGEEVERKTSVKQKGTARMARLLGVDLPREKRLEVALTYIFGIGRTRSLETLKETGISGDRRVHELGDDELIQLRDWIEGHYRIEGDLRREVQADIRRKIEIGCYQGIRHRRGLPVHGQRTQTNARTRKGKKKTVAGKKKTGKK